MLRRAGFELGSHASSNEFEPATENGINPVNVQNVRTSRAFSTAGRHLNVPSFSRYNVPLSTLHIPNVHTLQLRTSSPPPAGSPARPKNSSTCISQASAVPIHHPGQQECANRAQHEPASQSSVGLAASNIASPPLPTWPSCAYLPFLIPPSPFAGVARPIHISCVSL